MNMPHQELAAGMVVVRRGPSGKRVLLLHRRDQWRLPKGKLQPGESAAEAAERGLAEEAGLHVAAGEYLGAHSYQYQAPDGGWVNKIVFFFAARVGEKAEVRLEAGFDDFAWLPPAEAMQRLSWPNEALMVARASSLG